jgi:H+/Na+-translocating ferredoxin:NAD+ oxidoreductase subunit B
MTCVLSLAERIDDLLPQTQCTRCGYAGCRPYADAIVAGEAAIDRCPPGGDATIASLARLLGRETIPLDASRGPAGPRRVARIDEAACIGCTLCIQACPVDAIVGAPKRLHGVLSSLCSGCELCLPPCPVDCIVMEPAEREWDNDERHAARERFARRNQRLDEQRMARTERSTRVREAAIAAAFSRARARRRPPAAHS